MTNRVDEGQCRADEALTALADRPFALVRPRPQSVPFVFASPHSGKIYPPSFAALSRLDALELRQSEDAFVEELFAGAPELGAPLIAARFPRAFVDVNRAANEIDPAMFDALPALPTARTPRVVAGLGVIPRLVREGLEIYKTALPAREASFRLDAFYRPYHAALTKLVDDTRAHFGCAVLVDCHSMPSSVKVPDIVIGDQYGEAAGAALVAHARDALRACGFSVAYNSPYAGGHTTLAYGKPVAGVHALQIEINRALYLDEARMEKLATFDDCKKRLGKFIARFIDINAALLAPTRETKRERA